ncbi:hypothetical protein [Lysobacter fragariae]
MPITTLNLRGWRFTERYGPATRAAKLEFRRGGDVLGVVTLRATIGEESGVATLECNFGGEPRPTMERIEIVSIPAHFGGRLWFFVCPFSGRRARKIYRWPGMGFCHREASPVPPSYAHQNEAHLERTASAMARVRKRLGGWPGKVEKKPAGMDWGTYCRLSVRHAELRNRFWRLASRGLTEQLQSI